MSEDQRIEGKARKITLPEFDNRVDLGVYLKNKGFVLEDFEFDGKLYEDWFCRELVEVDGQWYKIDFDHVPKHDPYHFTGQHVYEGDDQYIVFNALFYNGGCGESEAVTECIKNANKRRSATT